MRKLTLSQLGRHLYRAADVLRSKMDASEYDIYIFGLLFLKRVSDEFDEAYHRQIRKLTVLRERPLPMEDAIRRAKDPSRLSDVFIVPDESKWTHIMENLHKPGVGELLNTALYPIEDHNPTLEGVLKHINYARQVGKTTLSDDVLRTLVRRFGRYSLRTEDFESPDLLGAAYEYLISQFADSAGKKGGEFYTPRDVVRLLVHLLKPQEGMRIYDPCVGSGGMLIQSKDYVEEQGGDARTLSLFGQDSNGKVWAICKMNMIFHNVLDADIANDDVLTKPAHTRGGELEHFDRVISNPPFSQDYNIKDLALPEIRFLYGNTHEKDQADLMFAQHMLAVLYQDGIMATVMPLGVLFRGGPVKKIREGFIQDDVLEAVIGLPPNLFYGTSIPACILIMRPKNGKKLYAPERAGNVLFINADNEYEPGSNQNFLRPEHIEKIVDTYEKFCRVKNSTGAIYANVISTKVIEENNYDLNIRRYADNAPPPEPQDVRAHLLGGIPKAEVADKEAQLTAHGLPIEAIFIEHNKGYYDFVPMLHERYEIKSLIELYPSVQAKEQTLHNTFNQWWQTHEQHLRKLPQTRSLKDLRINFMSSFDAELAPVGLLDSYKIAGIIARWWYDSLYDLKTVIADVSPNDPPPQPARGFPGLIESKVATITSMLTDEEDERDKTEKREEALSNKFIQRLIHDYIHELSQTEKLVADLQQERSDFEHSRDNENNGEDDEYLNESEDIEENGATLKNYVKELEERLKVSRASLKNAEKQLQDAKRREKKNGNNAQVQTLQLFATDEPEPIKQLTDNIESLSREVAELDAKLELYRQIKLQHTAASKRLRQLKDISYLVQTIENTYTNLTSQQCEDIFLNAAHDDLASELERHLLAHRHQVIASIENWWDKYRVTVQDIYKARNKAEQELTKLLKGLGYED